MAVRRRSNLVRVKSDRQMTWLGLFLANLVIPADSAVLIGILNAAALAIRPFIVVRFRADVLWSSDQAAVTEDPRGAVGATVVSEEASNAGVVSIPDPVTQSDADWFYHQGLANRFSFLSSVGFDGNVGEHYRADSKAMRKVGSNDDVVFIASNINASHGANITIMGRMLVKLH